MAAIDFSLGDVVVLDDVTNLDVGLKQGTVGNINSQMEDTEGNQFVMFHPEGTQNFYWMAAWRFKLVK